MTFLVKLNSLKPVTFRSVGYATRSQPLRYQTSWSHSTNETVKTDKDVNTDQKAFNEELTQEELNEMKKLSDDFGKTGDKEADKETAKKVAEQYAKGFKDLKDKGRRTAEEQERPEDYM